MRALARRLSVREGGEAREIGWKRPRKVRVRLARSSASAHLCKLGGGGRAS